MKRILGGIAIALLIIAALGFFLLPGILESNINRAALEGELGSVREQVTVLRADMERLHTELRVTAVTKDGVIRDLTASLCLVT